MFNTGDRIKIVRIEDDGSMEVEYAVGDTGTIVRAGFAALLVGVYDVEFDNGKSLEVFFEDMELA